MQNPGKTIRQIADELGVDKQQVYRFIRNNHINEVLHEVHHDVLHERGVKHYDDVAQSLIKQHFLDKSTSHDVHHDVHQSTSKVHQTTSIEALHDVLLMQLKDENDTLKEQLSIKDALIGQQQQSIQDLTSALLSAQQTAQAAQALHAGTIQAQLSDGSGSGKRDGFFSRIFGGSKKSAGASENIDVD